MKTADFLPPKAFLDHIERRRTPKRLFVLFIFCLVNLAAASAVQIEARSQERKAEIAETPDANAQQARVELQALFEAMTRAAIKLDPLTEHIKLPTSGEILAGLATAVGRSTEIEKIAWSLHVDSGKKGGPPKGRIEMVITAKVRGDEMLLALPERLGELTGYSEAKATRVELVKGRQDQIRLDVTLSNAFSVPKALAEKNKARR